MPCRVLILGGTAEAAALARALAPDPAFETVVSLAGRTRDPASAGVETRIGGFGGAAGLAAYLTAAKIDILIDATHPFAVRISENAVDAARSAGVARLAIVRPPWVPVAGDRWCEVADEGAAAEAVPQGARAFLALGRQRLAPFAARPDVWWLVRVVDPPEAPLMAGPHLALAGRGPFAPAAEEALLAGHRITHVVARNSGGDGGRAKIDAARALGLPVVMIARPPPPDGPAVASVGEALDRLAARVI